MRLLSLMSGCALMSLSTFVVADLPAPEGITLVTIAGDIGQTNRGASETDDLTVLAKMGVTFDAAASIDTTMLASLPQVEITSNLPGRETTGVFRGPLLSDVMALVGAEGKSAFPMALDGYQVEISWDYMQDHGPILATHFDGQPFGIGGLGPTMTVFPVIDDTELYEEFRALQVWATFFIEVE